MIAQPCSGLLGWHRDHVAEFGKELPFRRALTMTNQLQQICAGFETFPPASADACSALRERFPDFDLDQYVNLLLHTNGLGEVIEADGDRHMHNMLMLPIEEAIAESEQQFQGAALVVGRPGVDGILFALQPRGPNVYAYHPTDREFALVAESIVEFLKAWVSHAVRLCDLAPVFQDTGYSQCSACSI